jgi:hypothetical protein
MTVFFAPQIHIAVNQFEAALTTMAWGIVNGVVERERRRLVSGLTELELQALKRNRVRTVAGTARILKMTALLDSRKGLWTRGGGDYKVIGPGKEPGTYDLMKVSTGQEINATLKTLAFRWRHVP